MTHRGPRTNHGRKDGGREILRLRQPPLRMTDLQNVETPETAGNRSHAANSALGTGSPTRLLLLIVGQASSLSFPECVSLAPTNWASTMNRDHFPVAFAIVLYTSRCSGGDA